MRAGGFALLNASRVVGQRRSALESDRATNERMNASHTNLPGVKRMQWVIYHLLRSVNERETVRFSFGTCTDASRYPSPALMVPHHRYPEVKAERTQ